LMEVLDPRGVGVVIEAYHLCMMMRGVEKQNSKTVTSALRGALLQDAKTRGERRVPDRPRREGRPRHRRLARDRARRGRAAARRGRARGAACPYPRRRHDRPWNGPAL